MNSLYATFEFIRNHPLGSRHKLRAINNWLGWQLRSRMRPAPHAVSFVGDTRLLVSRGMHGATGNIYCGLHEFEDMAFVMHFLRPSDLFVDVGANIGSYTVIASGWCGARTIAIEPVAETADALVANVEFNHLGSQVRLERCVLGESSGTARVSIGLDCVNHVLTNGEAADAVEVPRYPLDKLLVTERPALIKIDVEGYEYPVLRGAEKTLADQSLQAAIVETNGSGRRYGHSDEEVIELLHAQGFEPFQYDAFRRKLVAATQTARSTGNTLFVRDTDFVQDRLRHAARTMILGQNL